MLAPSVIDSFDAFTAGATTGFPLASVPLAETANVTSQVAATVGCAVIFNFIGLLVSTSPKLENLTSLPSFLNIESEYGSPFTYTVREI
jgi:hypothetical protein